MDLLSHTLSGMVAGSVVAGYSKASPRKTAGLILTGTIAGMLPDLDVISLWSGFDGTFGHWFNLSHTGKEIYSARFWYSHHVMMHSFFASLVIPFFILMSLTSLIFLRKKSLKKSLHTLSGSKSFVLVFIQAYNLHLLEDMLTPGSTWGGVRYLWPLQTYIGGWGKLWWWNNYDIFLIIAAILIINLSSLTMNWYSRIKTHRLFTLSIFLAGFALAAIQVSKRPIDFSYEGHAPNYSEMELKSKQIQQNILGPGIYRKMEQLDKKIPFLF